MQTITDLWNGNIAPCEHCGSHDPQVNRLSESMEHQRDDLAAGFTAAQREAFEAYLRCSDAYLLRMLELAFYEGFCLGSRLATESLL